MKKIYFYAAALAVSAALSSCSESEVAEQIIEPAAPQGRPFGVTATLDGDNITRGVGFGDVDITSGTNGNFASVGFRLTGISRTNADVIAETDGIETTNGAFMTGANGGMNTKNFQYDPTKKIWVDDNTYYWSDNRETKYDFYATARRAGAANEKNRSPFLSPMYKNATTSTEDPGEADETEKGISYPQFTYCLPANAEKQEDLIVASKLGQTGADNDTLKLQFKHALARVKVQAIIKESKTVQDPNAISDWNQEEFRAWIKSVKFHGLASKSQFTFSSDDESTGTWSPAGSDTGDRGIITMDFGDNPRKVFSHNPTGSGENWNDGERAHLGYIYVIPEAAYQKNSYDAATQMLKPWNFVNKKPVHQDPDDVLSDQNNGTLGTAYIEVECCIISNSNHAFNVKSIAEADSSVVIDYVDIDNELDLENVNAANDAATMEDMSALLPTAGWSYDLYDETAVAADPSLANYIYSFGFYGLHGGHSLALPDADENLQNYSAGYGKLYMPLKIPNGFEMNKDYVLTINLQGGAVLKVIGDDGWAFAKLYENSQSTDQ